MSSFCTSATKIMIIWYTAPEIWHMKDVIIFHFGLFFALLPEKWKFQKNKKKTSGIIIILHQCIKNHDHMQYCSWDMASDGCNYFSFWAIFCPFAPNSPKKSKFQKNKKSTWRYHFTHVYQKFWLDDIQFLRNGVRQTDRWTEKVTQRGGWFT